MFASASQQARLEILCRPLIAEAHAGAQAIRAEAKAMNAEQLQQAAVEGVGTERFKRAKREREIARRAKADKATAG